MAMTLRIDENRDDKLEQLAKKYGVSKHDTLLRLIDSTYDRESFEADVAASAERGIAKFGDLLDRLGS